jgi:hypothetical protein
MNYKALAAATLIAAAAQAANVSDPLPSGWFESGPPQGRETCVVGSDASMKAQGIANISIKCEGNGNSFATVMQTIGAENYQGKRLRFSAEVKTENVGAITGLWMRVDDTGKPNAAFDNMSDRGLKGTQDWSRHAVVLDASSQASTINYGVLLLNDLPGQVWIRNITFEEVGQDVPITDMLKKPPQQQTLPDAPLNIELQ